MIKKGLMKITRGLSGEKISKKKRGFTLIELIVVVTVLGILASIAVVKYKNVQEEAKRSADITNASNIATSVMLAQHEKKYTQGMAVAKLVELGYLSNEPKPQSVEAANFTIEKGASNEESDFVVKAGTKVFYPEKDTP